MTGRDDTRDVIACAIGADQDDTDWSNATADAVLAALAAAGKTIVDDPGWEWGVRLPDGLVASQGNSEGWCRDYVDQASMNGRRDRQVVRRPVHYGQWEVAP